MTLIEAITNHNNKELARFPVDFTDVESFLETTDLNVWAGREVLTAAELKEWVGIVQIYSDRYKDAYGHRPLYTPGALSELREADDSITDYNSDMFKREAEFKARERVKAKRAAAEKRIRKSRSDKFGSMMFGDTLLEALQGAAR